MTTPTAVAVALTRAGWRHDAVDIDTWNHPIAGTVEISTSGDGGRVRLHIVDLTPEQAVEALSGAGLIHTTGNARVRQAVAAIDAAGASNPIEANAILIIHQRNVALTGPEIDQVLGHYIDPTSEDGRQMAHDLQIRCRDVECQDCYPSLPIIDAGTTSNAGDQR